MASYEWGLSKKKKKNEGRAHYRGIENIQADKLLLYKDNS